MDSPPKKARVGEQVQGDAEARSSTDVPPGFAMAAPVPAPDDDVVVGGNEDMLARELEALLNGDDLDVLFQVHDELREDPSLAQNLHGILEGNRHVQRDESD